MSARAWLRCSPAKAFADSLPAEDIPQLLVAASSLTTMLAARLAAMEPKGGMIGWRFCARTLHSPREEERP